MFYLREFFELLVYQKLGAWFYPRDIHRRSREEIKMTSYQETMCSYGPTMIHILGV